MMNPQTLKALAHPTRQLIVAELSAGGPARAADLSIRLDIPANSISFHLRNLGHAGIASILEGRATNRKERWWSLTMESIKFDDSSLKETPEGRAALADYERKGKVSLRKLIDHSLAARITGDPWAFLVDASMRVSVSDIATVRDEILDVFAKHRTTPDAGPGDTQLVFAATLLAPLNELLA